jgi:hypothetical protein
MPAARQLLRRYRLALSAVGVSAVVHAIVIVGLPGRFGARDDAAASATYTASLEPAATVVDMGSAPAAPAPRRAAPKPKPTPRPAPPRP